MVARFGWRIAAPSARSRRSGRLWERFARHHDAVAALIVLILLFWAAILANLLAPHGLAEQFRDAVLVPPAWGGGTSEFILGTDELGRDIWSRLLQGVRLTLSIALFSVVLASCRAH